MNILTLFGYWNPIEFIPKYCSIDILLEELGHNDQDCLTQWKQIKDARVLTRNPFTVCSAQQTRPTVGRTQQPKLQKCPDIRRYIVSISHSPPTFQMESQRFLCKTMTKDPSQCSHHPTRRCWLLQCLVCLLILLQWRPQRY